MEINKLYYVNHFDCLLFANQIINGIFIDTSYFISSLDLAFDWIIYILFAKLEWQESINCKKGKYIHKAYNTKPSQKVQLAYFLVNLSCLVMAS